MQAEFTCRPHPNTEAQRRHIKSSNLRLHIFIDIIVVRIDRALYNNVRGNELILIERVGGLHETHTIVRRIKWVPWHQAWAQLKRRIVGIEMPTAHENDRVPIVI